jgi:glycine/D-amino acid oxidase-like deaminating enzyme
VSADVAIVGARITGLSTAFHLGERDAGRIVVYEREGIGSQASRPSAPADVHDRRGIFITAFRDGYHARWRLLEATLQP